MGRRVVFRTIAQKTQASQGTLPRRGETRLLVLYSAGQHGREVGWGLQARPCWRKHTGQAEGTGTVREGGSVSGETMYYRS
jgi:hypothetical protein